MTVIHSARLVSAGRETADAWVRFEGDRVAANGTGAGWRECASPAENIVDAEGGVLAPGFIDLHGHGGGGASFDHDEGSIRRALATHRAHGTTRSVLSLVTAPADVLADRVRRVARLAAEDPLVLGSHLEGPFLDPGHKGAHDPGLLVVPTADRVAALLEAGGGSVVQVTLAPELPGALDAIDAVVGAGARAAVGHTAAGYDEALAAFDRGASILTHAFNAMDGLHHRAPGPIGAALDRAGVTLELICDGVHVHRVVARALFAAAHGRVALITDAMAAAGAPDGDYVLGSLDVEVTGGVARLAGGGSIAGSTLTLDAALRFAVREAGLALPDAVDALTRTPARALGRADLGALEAGFAADAVLFGSDLEVRRVWGAGREFA